MFMFTVHFLCDLQRFMLQSCEFLQYVLLFACMINLQTCPELTHVNLENNSNNNNNNNNNSSSSSLVCKQAPGREARHRILNDVVARAFASAGLPVSEEPAGLNRVDRKRLDGMTLIPWQAGNNQQCAWSNSAVTTVFN